VALPSKILMEFCCVGVRLVVKKEILVNFPSTARKSPLAHRPHGHTGIAVLPAARCLPPPVANGARVHFHRAGCATELLHGFVEVADGS